MKLKRNHPISKVIGVILLCVLGSLLVISSIGLLLFEDGPDFGSSRLCSTLMDDHMSEVIQTLSFADEDSYTEVLEQTLNESETNIRYEISRWDKDTEAFELVSSNQKNNDVYQAVMTNQYIVVNDDTQSYGYLTYGYYTDLSDAETLYELNFSLLKDFVVEDEYAKVASHYYSLQAMQNMFLPVIVVSAVLMFIILVFEISVSGHRYEDNTIVLHPMIKWPWDVFTFFTIIVVAVLCIPLSSAVKMTFSSIPYGLALSTGLAMLISLIVYYWIILTSVQIKTHSLWQRTLLCHIMNRFSYLITMIPAVIRTVVLATIGFLFYFSFLGAVYADSDFAYFALVLVGVGIWVACIVNAYFIQILNVATEKITSGYLDEVIPEKDMKRLFGPYKTYAQNLNAIREGMKKAIEDELNSERLKTELITNVSHDIKTPLTSIINYVDLLQKNPNEEQRMQYLDVLQRQSARLKRLTEDVVEASKASTGNIDVDVQNTSINEILDQAISEYEAAFENIHLDIVTNIPEDCTVQSDGRLIWRILRNVFSNVSKYSLEHTRVYIDVEKQNNGVRITVRNISKDALHISPEELMERFTRGDSSRHSEGSGLGLNICESLAKLLQGSFRVEIEGDLFKVILDLPNMQ